MKLVVGLGNPGKKYAKDRHNVGRRVVERMAREKGVEWNNEMGGRTARTGDVLLVVSGEGSYMNESGKWVKALRDFYKLANSEVCVVYDDLDLELGRVVMRKKGPKVHRGVNSVTEEIGGGYVHVRCGVDERRGIREGSGVEYVLGKIGNEVEAERMEVEAVRVVAGWAW